jgi:hypothetical protein
MWWCCKARRITPHSRNKLTTIRSNLYQGVRRVVRTVVTLCKHQVAEFFKTKMPTKIDLKTRTTPYAALFTPQGQPTQIPSL